jgi:hypothetical protein
MHKLVIEVIWGDSIIFCKMVARRMKCTNCLQLTPKVFLSQVGPALPEHMIWETGRVASSKGI